jgi:NDP-mannose synthase
MKAVLLSGGKGTRLRPYTVNFPKPLMPIGETPILEFVIKKLKTNGISDILIATGYLDEMIKLYFGNGEKWGVNISYSKEEKPLGTAGPLSLLKDFLDDRFILMNGDVISDLDLSSMLKFHIDNSSMATIASSEREVQIDYGVIKSDPTGVLTGWDEKPVIYYRVSMGIYLLEKEIIDYIPLNQFYNIPDVFLDLIKKSQKVTTFLHKGYWLDIGRPEDYEKACNDYQNLQSPLNE